MTMAALYYLLRSRQTGQYLSARQSAGEATSEQGSQVESTQSERYLLLFQRDFEAMSYLNAHAPDLSDRFAVEPHSLNQLKTSLERWGFVGVAFVTDPLEPQVDFMARRLL